MNPASQRLALITTGGTIAGWADQADAQQHYTAGALSGSALLRSLPMRPEGLQLALDDMARINSKDADATFWLQLYRRVCHWLADAETGGIVITHGTDTLEESAFFLSELLPAPSKPIVLVCAMRPASHPQADGPQNLADALLLASHPSSAQQGILVVCGGQIHSAAALQKWHGSSLQPFITRTVLEDSHLAHACLGTIAAGQIQWLQPENYEVFWHSRQETLPEQLLNLEQSATTPRVEILTSHAGSSAAIVHALLAPSATPAFPPLAGLVVAGTGCGTIHAELEAALRQAQSLGIRVVRTSQCQGAVQSPADEPFLCWPALSPRQARVRLILQCL